MNIDVGNSSELTGRDKAITSLEQVRCAAPLQPHLHRSLVLAGCRQHRLPFHDVVADRLLHIQIDTRLAGLDHRQAMPMVWRGNQGDFRLLLLEQLTIVSIGGRAFLGRLALRHQFGCLGDHMLIHITQTNHFDRRHLDQMKEIRFTVPTGPNECHAQRLLDCTGIEARCAMPPTMPTPQFQSSESRVVS